MLFFDLPEMHNLIPKFKEVMKFSNVLSIKGNLGKFDPSRESNIIYLCFDLRNKCLSTSKLFVDFCGDKIDNKGEMIF
jgi:hypothetical protein